jgi:hypothetical protein
LSRNRFNQIARERHARRNWKVLTRSIAETHRL